MPDYATRSLTLNVGHHAYRLRVLSDRHQFVDHGGHASRLGISPARWSVFGQVWPTSQLLAQAMLRCDIQRRRILELGCGIGLASLVLQRRGADVIASDVHPLAEPFLAYNAALNELPAVRYRHLRWDAPPASLGRFDLIVASDVLHEPSHLPSLAALIARHAHERAEILFTDPGASDSERFTRLLEGQGFGFEQARCPMNDDDPPPHRGRLLSYRRGCAPALLS